MAQSCVVNLPARRRTREEHVTNLLLAAKLSSNAFYVRNLLETVSGASKPRLFLPVDPDAERTGIVFFCHIVGPMSFMLNPLNRLSWPIEHLFQRPFFKPVGYCRAFP